MVATQNGYKYIGGTSQLATIKAGAQHTQVRKGDTATVLGFLVRELNAACEPCNTLFGWRTAATNANVGGSPDSNHISGTAVDYNGGRHPNEAAHGGKRLGSGWSAYDTKAIRTLLAALNGVVHWGADYAPGYRDYMHFDVRATTSALAKAAKKIRGGTVRTTAAVNVRKGASTSSKSDRVIPKGYRFTYNGVVYRGGRLWLHTTAGHYVAAEYTTF
ncbi:M15 family metallopeptidase [Luteimicrobium sp. NPDC057192]|uniref:M15 family metallopeptidase n=1 Tax=Luteimicrobium sp. NPDC057192 TaxID=3346042 RepID=UPI0036314494